MRTLLNRTAAVMVGAGLLMAPRAVLNGEDQAVAWTNVANATVNGTVLQKTSGWDGVQDAGATSEQQLTSGDGYIEFTVGETTTMWLGGLSHGNDGTTYADVDF